MVKNVDSGDPFPSLPLQMADMYGEIVELNDRLQRDMAHKDNYITRLINTIQEAGLRVPPLVLPVKKDQSEDKDQLEKYADSESGQCCWFNYCGSIGL